MSQPPLEAQVGDVYSISDEWDLPLSFLSSFHVSLLRLRGVVVSPNTNF